MDIKKGATVASAVALLLGGAGCTNDTSESEPESLGRNESGLRCAGINDCKGTSECAGPDGENDCQGMNECKGEGGVSVHSEEECTSKDGTIISSAS